MKKTEKAVAVLVYDNFEQSEYEEPIRALKKAGYDPTIITAKEDDKKLQAFEHVNKGKTFQADMLLADARSEDYDVLVLPGGVINADRLRMVDKAQGWIHDFFDEGKLIAAICHAPWLLVSADAVEERRLTSYYTLQDDIRNAGGEWVDLSVVIDGNLITSRMPDDLPDFNDALISCIEQTVMA